MRLLLFATGSGLLLLLSWLWPHTNLFWSAIDTSLFSLLNGSLQGHPLWHGFWAATLSYESDLLLTLILVGLALGYVWPAPRERLRNLFWVCGIGLAGLLLVRWGGFLSRASPTLAVEPAVRSVNLLPWLHIRDSSLHSFPSDHAFVLLFATLFFFSFGRRWEGVASLFCLGLYGAGRLITGAHWVTDMAVGSVALALFLFALGVATLRPNKKGEGYMARCVRDSHPSSVMTSVSSRRTPPTPGR